MTIRDDSADLHGRNLCCRCAHSDAASTSYIQGDLNGKRNLTLSTTSADASPIGVAQDPDDSPPPYYPHIALEDPDMIWPKERLRRSLSHLLSRDYNLQDQCPDRLRKDDWYFFMRLGDMSHKVFYSHRHSELPSIKCNIWHDWSDVCCKHPDIDRYIKWPAKALGIDTRVVIGMLTSFALRHQWFRPLSSEMEEKTGGAYMLAEKLLRDENSLFRILIPPEATEYRSLMLENLFEAKYPFARLESSTDYEILENWKWYYDRPGTLGSYLDFEQSNLAKQYKYIAYFKTAMNGFPDEPDPPLLTRLWRKYFITRWTARCERDMFGTEISMV